jgi:hypothetical protein
MSRKRKSRKRNNAMKKWWRGLSATLKATIITGVFALITASCTTITSLLGVFPVINDQISRFFAPDMKLETVHFEPRKGQVISEYDGQVLEVLFHECWQSEADPQIVIKPKNESSVALAYLMTTSQEMLIKDISVILDDYSSAPNLSEIGRPVLQSPIGGGGIVTKYDLGSHAVSSYSKRQSLSRGNIYQIDFDSPFSFATEILLPEAGIVEFHLEVILEDSKGNEFLLESETYSHGWVSVEDPKMIEIISNNDIVTLVNCD